MNVSKFKTDTSYLTFIEKNQTTGEEFGDY